jgi:hypothetical protein
VFDGVSRQLLCMYVCGLKLMLRQSIASSTTSIGSSILKHREENGRRYHAYKEGSELNFIDSMMKKKVG